MCLGEILLHKIYNTVLYLHFINCPKFCTSKSIEIIFVIICNYSEIRAQITQVYQRLAFKSEEDKYKENTEFSYGFVHVYRVGRDNIVAIATRYGLDSPGIESRWEGVDFPYPSRPDLETTQPPTQWVPSLYGCKGAGAWS